MEDQKVIGRTVFAHEFAKQEEITVKAAAEIYDKVVGFIKKAADEGAAVRLKGIGTVTLRTLPGGTFRVPCDPTKTVEKGDRVRYNLKSKTREAGSEDAE